MTIFFTPQQAATSGWQKVGTDVKLTTITDRVLIRLSTTDLDAPLVCSPALYAVNQAANAIVCGFSTVGNVASIVSTATGTETAKPLLFYVPSERMRITTTGNVGINTATPTALLHIASGVDGDAVKLDRTGGVLLGFNITTSLAEIRTETNHQLKFSTNNTAAMFIDTSQKVSIGSSAPTTKFHVFDNTAQVLARFERSGVSRIDITNNITGGVAGADVGNGIGTSTSHYFYLFANNIPVLAISNDNKVSISNTGYAPTYLLDVNGTFRANNTVLLAATSGKNVQIGLDTPDQGFKLYVEGTAKINGAITFTNTITATDFTKQVSLGLTKIGSAAAIDASAALEVISTVAGVLLPRMTTAQRDAISSPTAGLIVYNTTTGKLNVRTGAGWEAVTSV